MGQIAGSLTNSAIQVPLVWDAFQRVHTTGLESKPRACHEVPHRLRDQDFTWFGKTSNASADMHRNPCEIIVDDLAFPSVQAAAHLKAERAHHIAQRTCATDCSRGSVEGG